MFYYWGVISPCALVVSSFRFKDSWVYIFNFIFLYFAFLCICAINFRWAGESIKVYLLFVHPCYVIIPIILNILIYILLCRNSKLKKSKEKFGSTINSELKFNGNSKSTIPNDFSFKSLNQKN